jgi:hypothetical protein
METKEDKILPNLSKKSAFKYVCKNCDYNTCKKSSYDTHILSAKHQRMTNEDNGGQNSAQILPLPSDTHTCACGKKYQHRQGLWKHKKFCNISNLDETKDFESDTKSSEIQELKEIMKYLMKENSEMKNMMFEVMKNGIVNTNTNHSHNTTTNSHNKAFNLNFFLNETCKDAMNIGEFVDSLKLQLSDLEKVGEAGYIEGISSIIVKNLKELDVTKRPVHCTDKKRETVYIKDADKWEKDEDKSKMHKLIKKVASKNIKMFDTYREAHPDCKQYHSKFSDQYHKIIYESMGGKGDNDFEKHEKIIKNVLKEVVVDKNI